MKTILVLAACIVLAQGVAASDKVQAKAGPDETQAPPDLPNPAAARAAPPVVPGEPTTPEAAVRALYVPYQAGGNESMSAFDNEGERAKRFSASLVKEMAAYFKTQETAGEPGGLDFDPIVNGQDYKIGKIDLKVEKTPAGKPVVVVASFKNFDEPMKLKYRLVQEGGVWRVDNIVSMSEPTWDLRTVLKDN